NVDKPMAGASHVVVFLCVLECKRHKEIAIDIGDPERCIASRQFRVPKMSTQRGFFECGVKYVNSPRVKVSRVEKRPLRVGADREVLVNCAAGRIIHWQRCSGAITEMPFRDSPILGRKEENRGSPSRIALRDLELCDSFIGNESSRS